MQLTNKDISLGENLNTTDVPPAHSRTDEHNKQDNRYSQVVETIGSRVMDGIRQPTTNISQENANEPIDTLVENNKKSHVAKANIPILSPRYIFSYSFYVELKEYNGRVLTIDQTASTFTAELRNATDEKEILEAEFEVSDIDKGDLELFRVGALFIWKIGKEQNNGTQQKISQIVFRRLSSWRTADIKRTEEIAKSRAAAIRTITVEDSATI